MAEMSATVQSGVASTMSGLAQKAFEGVKHRVITAVSSTGFGAHMPEETFQQIRTATRARGADPEIINAYKMGKQAVSAHAEAGALSESQLLDLAKKHQSSEQYQATQASARRSVGSTLLKSGGAGALAGAAIMAITLPVKAALAVVDVTVRAVTLGKVKPNTRDWVGVGTAAKWTAAGVGALTLGRELMQTPARKEAIAKAHLAGMMHANQEKATLRTGQKAVTAQPLDVSKDDYAGIPKGMEQSAEQQGKAAYHAARSEHQEMAVSAVPPDSQMNKEHAAAAAKAIGDIMAKKSGISGAAPVAGDIQSGLKRPEGKDDKGASL